MAHALFDALNGINVDSQTAFAFQTILSAQTHQQQPSSGITLSTVSDGVPMEEEDLFQCGKCKDQFTSFPIFVAHKKTHSPVRLETIPVAKTEQSVNSMMYSEIVQEQEFAQPITLTESDILSLGIDQGEPLNITGATQVLEGCAAAAAYLTTAGTELTTYQIPTAVAPDEVTITTSAMTTNEGMDEKGDLNEANSVTVSLLGAVQDQMCGEVRSGGDQGTNEGEAKKMKCMYCGKLFLKNFDLQQHVRSHTGERPFQCIVCGRAFSQKSNVKKHMDTHKVWPKRMHTLLNTKLLSISEDSTERIQVPGPQGDGVMSSTDTNVSGSSCNDSAEDNVACESASVSISTNPLDDVDRSYVCQFCPAVFKSYFQLKTHCKEHTQNKVYRCIQKNCSETFSDLDMFLEHTRLHESEAQYNCHVCNKAFRSLDDLGIHQYYHSVPMQRFSHRSVTCKKCKGKFSNMDSLKRHLLLESHSYPCPHCNKSFTTERYLRRHLTIHTSAKNFVCPHCCKSFKTEQYLNTHRVIHSDEKPFVCQHCSAAFNRSDKLTRHMQIHENTKKFKCPFSRHLGCEKEFNRRDKLKAHLLTHSAKYDQAHNKRGHTLQKQAHLKQHRKACSPTPTVERNSRLSMPGLEQKSTQSPKKTKETGATNSGNGKVNSAEQDGENKVSTIEIIVVPVGDQNKNNVFRVVFPNLTNAVDLSQSTTAPSDQVPTFSPKCEPDENS